MDVGLENLPEQWNIDRRLGLAGFENRWIRIETDCPQQCLVSLSDEIVEVLMCRLG